MTFKIMQGIWGPDGYRPLPSKVIIEGEYKVIYDGAQPSERRLIEGSQPTFSTNVAPSTVPSTALTEPANTVIG